MSTMESRTLEAGYQYHRSLICYW